MANGIRWAGRILAVVAAFVAAAGMATAWTTSNTVIITGADLSTVVNNATVPLHALAQFYLYSVAPLLVMALLLATTVGIRDGRARFVAGGVALLAAGMSGWGAVGWLPEQISTYPQPWEVRRLRLYAVALIVLGLLIATAAVALMARKFLMYDVVVVLVLGVLGCYHLAAMGALDGGGSGSILTPAAWRPGLALIAAAVTAGVAGSAAAVLRQPASARWAAGEAGPRSGRHTAVDGPIERRLC
jgi:hypothetical protein